MSDAETERQLLEAPDPSSYSLYNDSTISTVSCAMKANSKGTGSQLFST